MSELIMRTAATSDIEQLAAMRFDFALEEEAGLEVTHEQKSDYHDEMHEFLVEAIGSEHWVVWVAEYEEQVVSHIYLEMIHNVPRPGRLTQPFIYMTNVYTLPEFRGRGIGSRLAQVVEQWARELEHEFILVWPEGRGETFYAKNGYSVCSGPMELTFGRRQAE
ncbi:GNAT family N-acetyltransferase [Saccharibacillus sp. CPCC 101409]|uniref:GNAT family N-acetyltransferase n=1 Tax=Saccharibacillus sp. CPCC 101409 TaxID=3058041 RepID=UPI002671BD22|nr:GNAT family N-acetyltransferase [Saccharibacillus sp. CPCC 101409]MDO3410839.1 GNAT family N-acetyltransferase [Saccharibacillus sp. CPCC 101409]